MGILIDASVFIEAERGRLALSAKTKGREEEFFLSVITASELLYGVYRAGNAAVRARRSAFVEAILDQIPIIPIDLATARAHAQLRASLDSKGIPIGPYDSWLAAACIAHGHTLVTANIKEFGKVPGLIVENWIAAGST